jgi:hypothetical protein
MPKSMNLIRSLVFWAGLLVVIFVCWLWAHSQYRSVSYDYVLSPQNSILISSSEATIRVRNSRISPGGKFNSTGAWGNLRLQRLPERSRDWFKPASFRQGYRPNPSPVALARGIGIHDRIIDIPHWVILAVAVPSWLLLLRRSLHKIGKLCAAVNDPLL